MSNDRSTATRSSRHEANGYAYPGDLARFVKDRWGDVENLSGRADLLPDIATLEDFFSGCYHASMLRDEERPVTFRAILAGPTLFPSEGGPPEGLLRLEFSRSLPFRPNELRRLSVAADPQRTMIGVRQEEEGALRIWGLIHSGTRWLRNVQGGRQPGPSLLPAPVVHVHAPGLIEAYKGSELVGKLQEGTLLGSRMDLFKSEWLPAEFSRFLGTLMERHEVARKRARELRGERWAPLEPALLPKIAQRMIMRVISVVRDAHGGTIIFVPVGNVEDLSAEDPYIDIKYQFTDGAPRLRFPDLIVDLLNRLAQIYGASQRDRSGSIGWREFEKTTDEDIETLDKGIFEVAYLIAGLAAVDGAVVMSKDNELLGFGGMISGRIPDVKRVARALDLEGEKVAEEETENVGARHRSAYRLAGALPGSVTVVISQDGGVRFVRQKRGHVTYWEQE